MTWQKSRRIGGRPIHPPAHIVEHEQRVDEFLRASDVVKKRKRRRKKKEKVGGRQGQIRFKKLDGGGWGLIGPRHLLRTGRIVGVTKQNGSVLPTLVGKILTVDGEWVIAEVQR